MAEQIRAVKRIEKVRGKDVEGKVRVLERTYPHQLTLFQTFIPEDDPDDKYSNTIELYDAIPKYFSNARAMDVMRKDGIYLPTLERVFQHRHETYTVQIRPARVRGRTGAEKEYYPSPREELVEEALRKLACDKMNGVYLDNLAGVQFTLYELKQELKSRGHDIDLPRLIEALKICNGVNMTVSHSDGKVVLQSSIFPVLLLGSKKDWLEHPKETRCYIQFHPFITQCMSQLTYRQFDYGSYMSYTYRLSRWFHKRLAHNYTQAGMLQPYTIRMSTILRDSGTHQSSRPANNVRTVDEALEELRDRRILLSITKEVMRGARNSLSDVKYTLLPTIEFIDEAKKANIRAQQLLKQRGSLLPEKSTSEATAEPV